MGDPDAVARITHDVEHGLEGWENLLATAGPERILVDGVSIADRGGDPVETVAELLLESELGAQMVMHYASEEAVRRIAEHPQMLLGSDGIFGRHPHPRVAGSAARFLGRYAIRDGLVPPEEAIARLTARAADRFGLDDRGRIEVGKRADLVLLDPAAYLDTATYEQPLLRAEGVVGVWVAGERAWADGAPDGRPRRRSRPMRRGEMPSIAAERALAGRDVLPLKGSVAAPLPPHVREAVAGALDEHAVTPPSRGRLELREAIATQPAGAGRSRARAPGHERRHARAQPRLPRAARAGRRGDRADAVLLLRRPGRARGRRLRPRADR